MSDISRLISKEKKLIAGLREAKDGPQKEWLEYHQQILEALKELRAYQNFEEDVVRVNLDILYKDAIFRYIYRRKSEEGLLKGE